MMQIGSAATGERTAALELALVRLDEPSRSSRVLDCLALISCGEFNPEGIFVARAPGENGPSGLRGALVCLPLPGRSALFWIPQTAPHDPVLEDQLVRAAVAWLGQRGDKLAQAIINPADTPFAEPFLRCGFRRITRLRYMEHPLETIPS